MISSLLSHATLANISLQGEVVSNVSGFLVQSFAGPMASSFPMKVVDLGECEIAQQCELGKCQGGMGPLARYESVEYYSDCEACRFNRGPTRPPALSGRIGRDVAGRPLW